MNNTNQHLNWLGWASFTLCLLVGIWFLASPTPSTATGSVRAATPVAGTSVERAPVWAEGARVGHRNIEDIRVGDRVMARNPEVTDAERATWQEPDWKNWLKLSLEMPRSDGSTLKIEILRPEEWFVDQVGYAVASKPLTEEEQLEALVDEQLAETSMEFDWDLFDDDGLSLSQPTEVWVPLSPVRSWIRELTLQQAAIEQVGAELIGLTVEMDLPEMGAHGPAIVLDVVQSPVFGSGDGLPVTATFSHPPSDTVLDVVFEGEAESIGVTDNHLFWSVDQQAFLPIGEMEVGECVQTWQGDTKRIVSKLARPGPRNVYNLEVWSEHVYFVGKSNVLVHNSCLRNERVGLGRQDFLGDLGDDLRFAKEGHLSRPGWKEAGLSTSDSNLMGEFQNAFFEATSAAKEIRFNLRSVDVTGAWLVDPRSSALSHVATRTVTEWELHKILNDRRLFNKTTFFHNGTAAHGDDAWEMLLRLQREAR